ncbi:MAG: hypothetical protein IKK39_01085, partial [Thermoguttaceae bacterium]|nr:hypothetical protein [Thermoguttaceae bacterium]
MLYTKENWGPVPSGWTRRRLLGLQELSSEELTILLDLADRFRKDVLDNPENQRKLPLLNGKA